MQGVIRGMDSYGHNRQHVREPTEMGCRLAMSWNLRQKDTVSETPSLCGWSLLFPTVSGAVKPIAEHFPAAQAKGGIWIDDRAARGIPHRARQS